MRTAPSSADGVRVLSETEIRERLYGKHPSNDSIWSGSEILAAEVQQLRSQLMALRKEKDRLESQMEKIHPHPQTEVQPPARSLGEGWLGRLLGVMVLAGVMGYLLSVRMLQALPAGGEATPYTVQVAVYDGPVMARRAEGFLKELGYDAFLMENPRRNGQSRYRVYVGSFVTKEEARLENDRLMADSRFQAFKDAFVLVR